MAEQMRTNVNEGATMCLVGNLFPLNTAELGQLGYARRELGDNEQDKTSFIWLASELTDK